MTMMQNTSSGRSRRAAPRGWLREAGIAAAIGLALALGLGSADPLQAEEAEPKVAHAIDFTQQPAGDAVGWLKKNGFELRLDAKALDPRFTEKGLMLETKGREAGLFARKLEIADADRIRVVWGVDRYPEGADWEAGVFRVPIAVMVSFGEKEIDSGSFFVPDAPYFISLFLSQNARQDKPYVANYYHEGGRYFCVPCSASPGETVTTEFDLVRAFREEFGQSEVPPITSFSFQMNTEDTRGGARAWLSRVEFLAQ